jgi:hypothetical protein
MDFAKQLADLAMADREITSGVGVISRLQRQAETLRANSRSTAEIEKTIRVIEERLDVLCVRRNAIARAMANAPKETPRKKRRRTRTSDPT